MTPLRILCQRGLGDNIYLRPFIREAVKRNDVWLNTPWPELFEDLPVHFMRASTKLRTQAKNVSRQDAARWEEPKGFGPTVSVMYGHESLKRYGNIWRAIERFLPLNGAPPVFDLPPFAFSPRLGDLPIALVRPVTVRKEWRNEARNPKPEYVNAVAALLMKTHTVVSVADLQPGEEWLVGEAPPCHVAFHHGEVSVRGLLALVRKASVVVGGVGWIVPAAIALNVPAFVILGGNGAHNAPEVITDPRMNLSKITFAQPKDFCRCPNNLHKCEKTISNLPEQWATFSQRMGMTRSYGFPSVDSATTR